MDTLKHFIDIHREAFEDEQLPKGHLERFKHRLPAPRLTRKRMYLWGTWVAAAGIALLLLFHQTVPQKLLEIEPHVCGMQEEIDGLRIYYNMQMNEIVLRMQDLCKQAQVPGSKELLNETQQVLADSRQFEEQVLPTLPCSDIAAYSMNRHYEASLESLRFMLAKMEQMKTNRETCFTK